MTDILKQMLESDNLEDVELALIIMKKENMDTKKISEYYWSSDFLSTKVNKFEERLDLFQKHLRFPVEREGIYIKNTEGIWKE